MRDAEKNYLRAIIIMPHEKTITISFILLSHQLLFL